MPETVDPRVGALCAEFDIEVISGSRAPLPGQTRAVATIRRIIDRRGEGHARLVLCVLSEGRGNHALLDEVTLWAVSDLIMASADIVDADTSALLELFDNVPLGAYLAIVNELYGIVRQREALAGMLYLHVRRLREKSLTGRETSYNHKVKANRSEHDKGRASYFGPRLSDEKKREIGRRLLEVKARLPHGQFGSWLQEKSGMSAETARKCMRMARG